MNAVRRYIDISTANIQANKASKKEFIIHCQHKSMHNKYLFVEALELIKVFAASFNCLKKGKE